MYDHRYVFGHLEEVSLDIYNFHGEIKIYDLGQNYFLCLDQ